MVGAIAKDDERVINLERTEGQCEAMHCSETGRGDGLGAPVARAVMGRALASCSPKWRIGGHWSVRDSVERGKERVALDALGRGCGARLLNAVLLRWLLLPNSFRSASGVAAAPGRGEAVHRVRSDRPGPSLNDGMGDRA